MRLQTYEWSGKCCCGQLTEILEETSKIKQPEEVAERLVDHLEAGRIFLKDDQSPSFFVSALVRI